MAKVRGYLVQCPAVVFSVVLLIWDDWMDWMDRGYGGLVDMGKLEGLVMVGVDRGFGDSWLEILG